MIAGFCDAYPQGNHTYCNTQKLPSGFADQGNGFCTFWHKNAAVVLEMDSQDRTWVLSVGGGGKAYEGCLMFRQPSFLFKPEKTERIIPL